MSNINKNGTRGRSVLGMSSIFYLMFSQMSSFWGTDHYTAPPTFICSRTRDYQRTVVSVTRMNFFVFIPSTKAAAPTPSPSPDTDVDEAEMEEEDDDVVEEEEDDEEDDVDEEEVEEEEEEEAMAAKDPEEYEYSFDSGPYQTSDYLSTFYSENGYKPTTSAPLMKGDSCECFHFPLRRSDKRRYQCLWKNNPN